MLALYPCQRIYSLNQSLLDKKHKVNCNEIWFVLTWSYYLSSSCRGQGCQIKSLCWCYLLISEFNGRPQGLPGLFLPKRKWMGHQDRRRSRESVNEERSSKRWNGPELGERLEAHWYIVPSRLGPLPFVSGKLFCVNVLLCAGLDG